MKEDEFSLLFHRAQVNLVAFKMLYEPEAFEAMQRMVEMAIKETRNETIEEIAIEFEKMKVFEADTMASIAAFIRDMKK
jgi:hypothetical protein